MVAKANESPARWETSGAEMASQGEHKYKATRTACNAAPQIRDLPRERSLESRVARHEPAVNRDKRRRRLLLMRPLVQIPRCTPCEGVGRQINLRDC
jgi:hypothetical protein